MSSTKGAARAEKRTGGWTPWSEPHSSQRCPPPPSLSTGHIMSPSCAVPRVMKAPWLVRAGSTKAPELTPRLRGSARDGSSTNGRQKKPAMARTAHSLTISLALLPCSRPISQSARTSALRHQHQSPSQLAGDYSGIPV